MARRSAGGLRPARPGAPAQSARRAPRPHRRRHREPPGRPRADARVVHTRSRAQSSQLVRAARARGRRVERGPLLGGGQTARAGFGAQPWRACSGARPRASGSAPAHSTRLPAAPVPRPGGVADELSRGEPAAREEKILVAPSCPCCTLRTTWAAATASRAVPTFLEWVKRYPFGGFGEVRALLRSVKHQ